MTKLKGYIAAIGHRLRYLIENALHKISNALAQAPKAVRILAQVAAAVLVCVAFGLLFFAVFFITLIVINLLFAISPILGWLGCLALMGWWLLSISGLRVGDLVPEQRTQATVKVVA